MNIAIIEYNNCHFTYISLIAKLYNSHNNSVTMFVTKEISEAMKFYLKDSYGDFEWIVLKEYIKTRKFSSLEKIIRMIILGISLNKRDFEKIIFCSPEYNSFHNALILYFYKKNAEKILTFHNINDVFFSSCNITNKYKRYIAMNATSFIVLEENIKYYLEKNGLLEKKIYVVPFDYYKSDEAVINKVVNNKISFVVPGNIEKRRKKYEDLICVFDKILENKNVELVLLGSGKSEYALNVIEWAKINAKSGKNIIYYESFVPFDEYESRLKNASCIINPINIDSEGELYGISKASGSVSEMISFVKPGVYPKEYLAPDALKDSILIYKDLDDFYELLNNFINDENLRKRLQQNAISNSSKFTLEKIRESLDSV